MNKKTLIIILAIVFILVLASAACNSDTINEIGRQPEPEPTAAVPETQTLVPQISESASPAGTPGPTPIQEPMVTPEPSATPISTVTPTPTVTPDPTVTPEPTTSPDSSTTPEPTISPDPTVTPEQLVPSEHLINNTTIEIPEDYILPPIIQEEYIFSGKEGAELTKELNGIEYKFELGEYLLYQNNIIDFLIKFYNLYETDFEDDIGIDEDTGGRSIRVQRADMVIVNPLSLKSIIERLTLEKFGSMKYYSLDLYQQLKAYNSEPPFIGQFTDRLKEIKDNYSDSFISIVNAFDLLKFKGLLDPLYEPDLFAMYSDMENEELIMNNVEFFYNSLGREESEFLGFRMAVFLKETYGDEIINDVIRLIRNSQFEELSGNNTKWALKSSTTEHIFDEFVDWYNENKSRFDVEFHRKDIADNTIFQLFPVFSVLEELYTEAILCNWRARHNDSYIEFGYYHQIEFSNSHYFEVDFTNGFGFLQTLQFEPIGIAVSIGTDGKHSLYFYSVDNELISIIEVEDEDKDIFVRGAVRIVVEGDGSSITIKPDLNKICN